MLEKITKANDIKRIPSEKWDLLAEEIRGFLLENVSHTGGHLASNLGTVELTMALHLALNLPEDKIIWDVGHQCYTHKILTGRKEGFATLRSFGGMSGFPKTNESPCDAFNTGHSSTSISAGLGYVKARDIQQEKYTVVSVIGDGSMTGGMAYEALNNVAQLHSNFIIILNDNNMSISENVGGLSRYLNGIRTADAYTDLKKGVEKTLKKIPVAGNHMVEQIRKTKSSIKQFFVPGMFFEEIGVTYLGPVDGHNTKDLLRVIQEAKRMDHGVLIHVVTQKGKGYLPAEHNPSAFHGVGAFAMASGNLSSDKKAKSYTDFFSEQMVKEGEQNHKVVGITAAMASGTGLMEFAKKFPQRFFDVGIAEAHGVTFGAGLASGGLRPVFAVYSSFLQRGFDQILHDVCLQNLPLCLAIDRAGLVGSDGETHQGIFDVSFLRMIPSMTILAPKDGLELQEMLHYGLQHQGPVAIRYPRGKAFVMEQEHKEPITYGKCEVLCRGEKIALWAVGHMMEETIKAAQKLKEKGHHVTLINSRFIKPIDTNQVKELCNGHELLVVVEENMRQGGVGEAILSYVKENNLPLQVLIVAIEDQFVEHGSVAQLRKYLKIDADSICDKVEMAYGKER